ncbi:MAG: hypothetical protein LKCHEGNO_00463 [Burkholderiaceae bacterium]|nr:hypothetical protein [Burkholderiaceae bacterium]
MVTEHEYAELSNRVYDRSRVNRTPVPLEWTEVHWLSDAETNGTGFSAGVYQKGNEVVISFTGTNKGKVLDTLAANIPLGIGLSSMQLQQAIGLYLQTKAQHPDATISFTGHSLGGGLASVMAVDFNKEATTTARSAAMR